MEATRTGVRKRSGSKAVDNASTESTVAAVKKEHGSAQPDISSSSNAAVARDLQTPSPRMIAPRARVPVDSKCTEPKHGKNEARSEEPPAALTFASLLSTAHTTEMRCGAWDEDGDSSEILCDSECVAGLSGQTIPPAPPLPPCPMRRKRSLSDADHSALYAATQTMVSSLKDGPQPPSNGASASPPVCLSHFQESPRKRPAPAPIQRSARSLSNEEGLFPPLRTVHSDNKLQSLDEYLNEKATPLGLSISPPVPPLHSPTRSLDAAVTPPHLAPPPPLDAVGGSPAGGGRNWAGAVAASPTTATEAGGACGTGGASSPNADSPNLPVAPVEEDDDSCP